MALPRLWCAIRPRVGEPLSRLGEPLSRLGERVGEPLSRLGEPLSRIDQPFSSGGERPEGGRQRVDIVRVGETNSLVCAYGTVYIYMDNGKTHSVYNAVVTPWTTLGDLIIG